MPTPGVRISWAEKSVIIFLGSLNLSLENVAACEARYCSNLEVNPCLKIVMNGVLVQIFFFYAQVLLSSEINSIMCLLLVFFVQFCS